MALKWTKEVPTKPGLYWAYTDFLKPGYLVAKVHPKGHNYYYGHGGSMPGYMLGEGSLLTYCPIELPDLLDQSKMKIYWNSKHHESWWWCLHPRHGLVLFIGRQGDENVGTIVSCPTYSIADNMGSTTSIWHSASLGPKIEVLPPGQ